MTTPPTILSFDIGHESIGWAAIREPTAADSHPSILGAGTVIFEENCQNQQRAAFRRQRRHIAATRNRIRRLETVLKAKGLLTDDEIAAARRPDATRPQPWWLAARILQGRTAVGRWQELWPVLRWYAHNRGYDGNARWARGGTDDTTKDTGKVEKANALMADYGTSTMAETICAFLGIDPAGEEPSVPSRYFKGQNAAFRRSVVESEVRKILEAHRPALPCMNDDLIEGLAGSADDAWKRLGGGHVRLPDRYAGSLLFGQMVPRFDNRIIPTCRITGAKTPGKDCPEFYRYRWAMLLNNLRISDSAENEPRPLRAEERQAVDARMQEAGFFTRSSLKAACAGVLSGVPSNLDQMFMTPEMERALVLDPARRETTRGVLKHVWPTLSESWQKRFLQKLRRARNRPPRLADWREQLARSNEDLKDFDAAVSQTVDERNKRERKNSQEDTVDMILREPIPLQDRASGRAPYTRELMAQASEWVLSGKDPKATKGPLEETSEVITRQLNQALAERTNNHLVRHRMQVFGKLLEQGIDHYCPNGSPPKVVIEVVRELQEFSGKTNEEKGWMMRQKLDGHREAVKYLENELPGLGGFEISHALIKKVRIAQDLGWKCPYSGNNYCLSDILEGRMDLEHIIPRSWRPSDSLESLVLTSRETNQRKGGRLAWQFIQDEGGGDLFTPTQFEGFVDKLKPRHDPRKRKGNLRKVIDDDLRRWRRRQFLLTESYEKRRADTTTGFTSGHLSRTSFLNKIAAQEALVRLQNRIDPNHGQDPRGIAAGLITQLPGSVTSATRRAWRLTDCLSPLVDVTNKTKTELRGETHLHHAVDAIAAGLACYYLPAHGNVWGLLSRRKLKPAEADCLRRSLRLPVRISSQGSWHIDDLPDEVKSQVRSALEEERVVQHLPHTLRGLRVEENTWRVLGPDPRHPKKLKLTQRERDKKSQERLPRKHGCEKASMLLGHVPPGGTRGKLARLRGALIVKENYGVALDPDPKVIPHLRVWQQLDDIRKKNGGRLPRVLRKGSIISVPPSDSYKYTGRWRVLSIKDNSAKGILLYLSRVHSVKVTARELSRVHSVKVTAREILLKTLLKNGMQVEQSDLLGLVTGAQD